MFWRSNWIKFFFFWSASSFEWISLFAVIFSFFSIRLILPKNDGPTKNSIVNNTILLTFNFWWSFFFLKNTTKHTLTRDFFLEQSKFLVHTLQNKNIIFFKFAKLSANQTLFAKLLEKLSRKSFRRWKYYLSICTKNLF